MDGRVNIRLWRMSESSIVLALPTLRVWRLSVLRRPHEHDQAMHEHKKGYLAYSCTRKTIIQINPLYLFIDSTQA